MSGGRTFKVIFDGALTPELKASIQEVGGRVEDVEKKTTSAGDKMATAFKVGAGGAIAFGVGVEALARKQQDMNVVVGQTAAAMGVSNAAFRETATSIANAGFPLKDVVELMKLGNQEGLKGEALSVYAGFWDDVGDATGKSAVSLAENATGLRAVGIAAGNEGQALAAFGFITDHTKLGVDDFLTLLQKKGANLREFGISIDDTAAVLGVMEKSLGLTGRAAATEFADALEKSDGSMASLLEHLGITKEQFDAMRQAVDASSGVIERNAQIQEDTITSLERWRNKLDEFLFSHADLVQGLEQAAPLVIAGGTAVEGLAAAYGRLSPAQLGVVAGLGQVALGAGIAFGAVRLLGEGFERLTASTYSAMDAENAYHAILGDGADKVSRENAAVVLLTKATEDWHDKNDGLKGSVLEVTSSILGMAGITSESEKAFQRQAAQVRQAATELVRAGDTTEQLKSVQSELPHQLQDIFYAAVKAAGGYNDLAGSALNAAGATHTLAVTLADLVNMELDVYKTHSVDLFGNVIQDTVDGLGHIVPPKIPGPVFLSSGGGGGGSAAAAAKELVVTFEDAMREALQGLELSAEFGNAGERVMEAFGQALADPKKASGIAPAIASLITEAERANVPNAKELGEAVIAAVSEGLRTGDWAGIYAAMHAIADSLSPVAIEHAKAAADIEKAQAALAASFASTAAAVSRATAKEGEDLAALARSHEEALGKIRASIAEAQAAYAEASAARAADYAEARAQRQADADDARETRHQNAIEAEAQRHADAAEAAAARHADEVEALERLAETHEERLQKIAEDEMKVQSGATREQAEAAVAAARRAADRARDEENKKYQAAVAAEQKKAAKADADAAARLAKQDAEAAKSLAKQDAAAAKSLAKQEEQAAKALAKQEAAAAKAEAAKEKALNESLAAEDKRYAEQVETQRKRYAEELKALKDAYAEKEKAANEHVAALARILAGTPGHMRPVTLDPTVPMDGDWAWDSANQRWVDTRHMPMPGYAEGTMGAPGGLAWVGERGPELMNVPRGAQIFSNSESHRMAGGISVTFTGPVTMRTMADGRLVAGDMAYALSRALNARGYAA